MEQPPSLPQRKPAPAPGHFRPGQVIARWWWLAALVIAGISTVGYKSADWFNMRGPLYQSTALLEVKPIPKFDAATTSTGTLTSTSSGGSHRTSRFMSTQQEIIQAQATLELAIKQNDLLNRLGGSQTEVLRRMQKSLRVSQRYGTDLIEISYRDEDPQLAQDTVTAIYQSYAERRTELEMQIRDTELSYLEVELENKIARASELRKRLTKIAENAGIIFNEEDDDVSIDARRLREKAEKELYKANREKEQLRFQIEKLLTLNDDGDAIPLWVPEAKKFDLKELQEQYQKEREILDKLRAAGLGKEHPDIREHEKAVKIYLAELKKRKNVATRESLKLKLKAVETRVQKLRKMLNEEQDKETTRAREIQEFNLARKEYQAAKITKDQLQVKRDTAKAKMRLPVVNHIIHQKPELPTTPVTKGRDFFTTLFTLIAIPCAAITAVILIYLAEAICPRRCST